MRACSESQCCHALLHPGHVQPVEGFLEVQEEDSGLRLCADESLWSKMLDSHAPNSAAAMTHNRSLPGLKAGSLPRLQNMVWYDNPPSTCPFGTAPPPICQSMSYKIRRYKPLHCVSPLCRMLLAVVA